MFENDEPVGILSLSEFLEGKKGKSASVSSEPKEETESGGVTKYWDWSDLAGPAGITDSNTGVDNPSLVKRKQALDAYDQANQDILEKQKKAATVAPGMGSYFSQKEQLRDLEKTDEFQDYESGRKKVSDENPFIPTYSLQDIRKIREKLEGQRDATPRVYANVPPGGGFIPVSEDEEKRAAKRMRYTQSIDFLKAAEKLYNPSIEKDGIKSIISGFGSGIVKDFASAGISELIRYADVATVAEKKRRGEELNDDEQSVLTAYGVLREMESGTKKSISYDVARGVKDMIPYMVQFAATGNVGSTAKAAITKLLGSFGKKIAGKAIGYTAGALAQTAVMPIAPTDYFERRIGDVTPDGDLVEGSEDGRLEAAFKAGATAFSEVFTEGLGAYMGRPLSWIARKTGPIGKSVLNPVERFAKAAKFDGWLAEYLEEVVNSQMQPLLTGDRPIGFGEGKSFDPREQLVTLLTVSAMGGGTYGLSKIYDKADNALLEYSIYDLVDTDAAELKRLAGLDDPKEIATGLIDFVNSGQLSERQNKAAIKYVVRSVARNADAMGEKADQLINRLNAELVVENRMNVVTRSDGQVIEAVIGDGKNAQKVWVIEGDPFSDKTVIVRSTQNQEDQPSMIGSGELRDVQVHEHEEYKGRMLAEELNRLQVTKLQEDIQDGIETPPTPETITQSQGSHTVSGAQAESRVLNGTTGTWTSDKGPRHGVIISDQPNAAGMVEFLYEENGEEFNEWINPNNFISDQARAEEEQVKQQIDRALQSTKEVEEEPGEPTGEVPTVSYSLPTKGGKKTTLDGVKTSEEEVQINKVFTTKPTGTLKALKANYPKRDWSIVDHTEDDPDAPAQFVIVGKSKVSKSKGQVEPAPVATHQQPEVQKPVAESPITEDLTEPAVDKIATTEDVVRKKAAEQQPTPTPTRPEIRTEPVTPEEEREAGYRVVNGDRVKRQNPIEKKASGSESKLYFSNDIQQPGKWTVVEADELQQSHVQRSRNPLHFIPEAQPKERTDLASDVAAEQIAIKLDPEVITTKTTNAYSGAPTVNTRGEVIQGNNRASALKRYWDRYPNDDRGYREYLKKIASETGISPEALDRFTKPVLVNMVDVSDKDAILLGQYIGEDMETGGKSRIRPKETVRKAGDKLNRLIEIATAQEDKEESLRETIRRNGIAAIRFMNHHGMINDNQLQSALKPDGKTLKKEAIDDIEGVILYNIFEGGRADMGDLFERLRYNIQNAIIRSSGVIQTQGLKEDIQDAIEGYHEFIGTQYGQEMTSDSVKDWSRQMDLLSGAAPVERYSPQTLRFIEIFTTFKDQKALVNLFDKLGRLTEGETTIFGTTAPMEFEAAFKETFGVDYDAKKRGNFKVTQGKGEETPDAGRDQTVPAGPYRKEGGTGVVDQPGGGGLRRGEQGQSPQDPVQAVPGSVPSGIKYYKKATNTGGTFYQDESGKVVPFESIPKDATIVDDSIEKAPFDKPKFAGEVIEKGTSEQEYRAMSVDDLVKLKKSKYPNPDITTPMSEDEKLLDRIIAEKFSEINQGILEKRKKEKEYGKSNTIFTEDAAAKAREILKRKLGNLNAGIDPEVMMAGIQLAGYHIEAGARKFADFSRAMINDIGEGIRPYLKSFYESIRNWPGFVPKDLDSQQFVSNFDIDNFNPQENVFDRPESSQPDRTNRADAVPGDEESVPAGRETSREGGTGTQKPGEEGNRGRPGGKSGSGLFTPDPGEPGNQPVHQPDQKPATKGNDARDSYSTGSLLGSTEGVYDESGADQENEEGDPYASKSFAEQTARRLKLQKKAEPVKVVIGDLENIKETLPFLLPEQQDDVLKSETRFFSPVHKTQALANGKGFLFTNGTGTGKTYTGLGIVKRFAKQGKKNILIVVPTQPKVNDWANDGKNLFLDIKPLPDTSTGGEGIVVTTYANFRANNELLKRDFDLIIYDECHRLMESKAGSASQTTETHYLAANKDFGYAFRRLTGTHPLWIEERKLNEMIRRQAKSMRNPDLMDHIYQKYQKKLDEYEAKLEKIKEQQESVRPGIEERAKQAAENTKVVFLSATPFKSHFNLRYANGFLFDWGNETTYEGYSRVDAESRFFLDHFGSAYEWKFHRLQTKQNANAEAIALQEVQFAEGLFEKGVMSGRVIESERDYSREFPRVAGLQTNDINQAFSDIYNYEANDFKRLRDAARSVFYDYNYSTQLFESLRTSVSIPRIRKHIELGRKVVVFHRRKQANASPPFAMVLAITRNTANGVLKSELSSQKQKDDAMEALTQASQFESKYASLLEYEKTLNYGSAINQISQAFGDRVVYVNGDITSKKTKSDNIRRFQDDNSGVDIIVVQEESGKEGISLHDQTGNRQRVLMSMSMPISSITALQMEGRIYRIGQETDAIFEYPILGLDMEIAHFGKNINKKLSTTENLAVGDQSRDLIRSFAEGVLFSEGEENPNKQQGIGGKEYDKKVQQAMSDFRKAILVYQSNQKNRRSRGQREGVDYFATPEPLGQKMVEWLDLQVEETALEPSAGHGAIAMWFPSFTNITAIEPAFELYSKLNARSGGGNRKIIQSTFEEHNIVNKYDGIVMNPPFGTAGKTAMNHVEKAFRHLRNGGRLVAIVPAGPSMDKRVDNFLYGKDEKGYTINPEAYLVGDILLPSVTFEQAGTSVNARVLVIDKHIAPLDDQPNFGSIDLRDAKKIGELFERLEFITVPGKEKPQESSPIPNLSLQTTDRGYILPNKTKEVGQFETFTQSHSQTGETLYMANPSIFLARPEYDRINKIAKKHGGYFSSYSSAVKNIKKGFVFKNEESRTKFLNEAGDASVPLSQGTQPKAGMTVQDVRKIVDKINSVAVNPPKIVVVANDTEFPEKIRQLASFKPNHIKAAVYPEAIYMNASMFSNRDQVVGTWVHEVGVHHGMTRLIPDKDIRDGLFRKVWMSANAHAMRGNEEYKKIIRFINENYPLRSNIEAQKGNEFLAYLSDKVIRGDQLTNADRTIWRQFINKMKELLARLFNFNADVLTTNEISNIVRAAVETNFSSRISKDQSIVNEVAKKRNPMFVGDMLKEEKFDQATRKKLNQIEKEYNETPYKESMVKFGISEKGKTFGEQVNPNKHHELIKDYLVTAFNGLGYTYTTDSEPSVKHSKSGTIYVSIPGQEIRISDHKGRGGVWTPSYDISTLDQAKSIIENTNTKKLSDEQNRLERDLKEKEKNELISFSDELKDKGLGFKSVERTYQSPEEFLLKHPEATKIRTTKLDSRSGQTAYKHEYLSPIDSYSKTPSAEYKDWYLEQLPETIIVNGVKEPTGNTGPFDTDNDDIRFRTVSPIGFYSTVENALESIKQGKGTPEQFKAMLLKNGAKQAELDWMGFDEFSQDKKSLTKAEIQEWIDQNKVEVEEVVKSDNAIIEDYLNGFVVVDENGKEWLTTDINDPEKFIYLDSKGDFEDWPLTEKGIFENNIEIPDGYGETETLNVRYQRNKETISPVEDYELEEKEDFQEKYPNEERGNTKFSQYQEPGGENYRELLLTMPEKRVNVTYSVIDDNVRYGGNYKVKNNVTGEEVLGSFKTKEAAEKWIQGQSGSRYSTKDNFKSDHFDEPNILAHVRFDDREVNGERVLFLEEIQSDWAQKGKKKGFRNDEAAQKTIDDLKAKVESTEKEMIEASKKMQEAYPYATRRDLKTGSVLTADIAKRESLLREVRNKREYDQITSEIESLKQDQIDTYNKWYEKAIENSRLIEQLEKAEKDAVDNNLNGIPNMPFKKTDQWVNLALRRMMMYAAENDYDRIAWTTGEQQAERYDLSKQVDKVLVSKYKDGYTLKVLLPDRAFNNDQTLIGENLTEAQLEERIGKDLTQKVISDNLPLGQTNVYEGHDLKVGGEGMKGFYDNIVPAQASKLVKPFGAKLETIVIQTKKESVKVNSIPITESMASSVQQGVPLFRSSTGKNVIEEAKYNALQKFFDKVSKEAIQAGKIHVYSSRSQVPKSLQRTLPNQKVFGFYTAQTGESYFILNEIDNVSEAFKTWVHEVGIHGGLRKIIPVSVFNKLMGKIYNDLGTKEIRRLIPEYYWELPEHIQAEEYLAFLAERIINEEDLTSSEISTWRKIIESFKELLNKLFRNAKFTTNDAETLVKTSVQNLFQRESLAGDMLQGKSRKDYSKRGEEEIRLRVSKLEKMSDGEFREKYRDWVPTMTNLENSFIERNIERTLIDSGQALKNLLDEVEKRGVTIGYDKSAYEEQLRSRGKNRTHMEDFDRDFEKPLLEAIADITTNDFDLSSEDLISYRDIEEYLKAKHGLERNEKMNDEAQAKTKGKYTNRIFGGIPTSMLHQRGLKKDASNVNEIRADITYEELTEYLKDTVRKFERNVNSDRLNNLWDKINKATNFTLDRWFSDGFLSLDEYLKLTGENGYKYYVPLRGWIGDAANDLFEYQNKQVGGAFNPNKKALGRSSEADDTIPYIISMAGSAIVAGNKNNTKRLLLHIARDSRDLAKDLIRVKYFYEVINDRGEWEDVGDARPEQKLFDEKKARIRRDRDVGRASKYEAAQHEVEVFENGEKKIVQLADPQAASAINGDNLQEMGPILETLSKFTRFWAALTTSKNPAFIIPNMIRDLRFAFRGIMVDEGVANSMRFMANYGKAQAAVLRAVSGKANMDKKYDKLYQQFRNDGGITGITKLDDIKKIKRKMEREAHQLIEERKKGIKNPLIWVKKLFLLENRLTTNLAEWSENISRFSTYLTYLDMGRSRQESATRAKEITTNFDRRGTWSSGINAAYAFFNARVQGIKRYGDLWKKNPGIMATWTAFDMALGFALAALMDSWYGDDPDDEGTKKGDKVNRFVRHNYLNIPVPGSDKLISIPNPHSFAFFHAIGSTLYDVMSGKMDGKEALSFSFDAFANNLIPIDLGGAFNNEGRLSARPIVPTFFVPIYDLTVNEDFAGRMIYREPFTKDLEKKLSPSQLYMNGTNRMLRVITDAAYQATGGDLETGMRYYYEGGKKKRAWGGEVNPAAIEHILETTLSGKGQFYNQLFKIAIRSLEKNKEPLQSYDIPVVSRFVRTAWGDPIKDKFYDNIREAGDIISAYKMAKGVIEQGNVLNEIGRTRYENAKEIIKINNQIRDINEDLASSKVTQAHKDLLMKKKRENMRKINQLEL